MGWSTKEVSNDLRLDPNDNVNKGDVYVGRYLGAFDRNSDRFGAFVLHRFLTTDKIKVGKEPVDTGTTVSAIGGALNAKLQDVRPGTMVRLTYLGKNLETRNGKAHNWTVEVDEDDFQEVAGAAPARRSEARAGAAVGIEPPDDF